MSKVTTNRLNGIDLCRGLAAFAVILVHSGDETWGLPISEAAIRFRYLFYFAVPFFLATSLYFGTRKLPITIDGNFWRKKFKRIVIPYLLWSLFYVVMKTGIYSLTNKTDELQRMLADPTALIFFGAASYHLYFIPLLIAGLALLYLANYLNKQNNQTLVLSAFVIFSLIIYQLLFSFQNDFNLSNNTAFPELLQLISIDNLLYQPWRIVLVYLSWAVRCLPYLAIALFVNHILQQNIGRWFYSRTTATVLLVICVLANAFAEQVLPIALSETIIAYSALLFGIAISKYLPESNLISSLGACSFGIYLIHPVIKRAIDILLVKFVPQVTQSISISSMLTYTVATFIVSWIVIYLMRQNKLIAQYV
ncbi:MAG: acyltransferase [Cyanobacteria bacterium J06621_12]